MRLAPPTNSVERRSNGERQPPLSALRPLDAGASTGVPVRLPSHLAKGRLAVPTMTVLVPNQENLDFPAIVEAARVLRRARALGCDRIRIEKCDGVRVTEFPVAVVDRFVREHQLVLQPDQRMDVGAIEPLRRVWRLGGSPAPG